VAHAQLAEQVCVRVQVCVRACASMGRAWTPVRTRVYAFYSACAPPHLACPRTAVKDLATVQGLAAQLLRYDAVTFLAQLEGVRLSQAGSSIWLYHEATHLLYEQV
jgi:hypothetical protein